MIVMTNPYYTNDWCVTEPQNKDILKEIQEAGYDGVVFTAPENDKELEYIAFENNQIKQIKSFSVAKIGDSQDVHGAEASSNATTKSEFTYPGPGM